MNWNDKVEEILESTLQSLESLGNLVESIGAAVTELETKVYVLNADVARLQQQVSGNPSIGEMDARHRQDSDIGSGYIPVVDNNDNDTESE